MNVPDDSGKMSGGDYARLADFRYALRRFLQFSEQAASTEGVTPVQHQALLVIRGREEGATTIAVLAERLCLKHHTTVELAQRMEAAGLLVKLASATDRRAVILKLSDKGARCLERLTAAHRAELRQIGPEILQALKALTSDS
ncbi:MAG: MarR family transcriptional regulator [Verrucomicrobiaceae bacterium]|nr:MAG: MarR family transcriptional regulator [Verrucomicrobiaceae bacterium]